MAKTHKGAKVLEDMTQGEGAPQVAQAEATGKRKKNQNIKIEYIKGDDTRTGSPSEDVKGFEVTTPRGKKTVLFDDLPQSILLQMAAFGGNTVYRNEFNTTLNTGGGTVEDAEDALQTRHDGFMRGEWRAIGEGGSNAIPLRIHAIKRALIDGGKTEEEAEAVFVKASDLYRNLATKELKAEQLKTWGLKGAIIKAEDQLRLEAAQAKAAKSAGSVSESLDDLGL